MKIEINIASKISYFSNKLLWNDPIEYFKSPKEVRKTIEDIIDNNVKSVTLITLQDYVLNIIGYLIAKKKIDYKDVTVKLWKDKDVVKEYYYKENGGMDSFLEIEKEVSWTYNN